MSGASDDTPVCLPLRQARAVRDILEDDTRHWQYHGMSEMAGSDDECRACYAYAVVAAAIRIAEAD